MCKAQIIPTTFLIDHILDMSQSYAHPVVSSYTQQQGYDYTPGMTTPFLATHSDSTSPTKSVPTTLEFASMHPSSQPTATSSYIPGGSSSSEPPRPTYTPSRSGQSSSQGSRSGASGNAALLAPVRPLPQPNQTTDSGVRFGPGGAPTDIMSETGEIPPAYSAD